MALSPERRSEITFGNVTSDDCGVVALQAVADLKRAEAMAALLGKGYEPGEGTTRGSVEEALRALGIDCYTSYDIGGETPASFALDHDSGSYLLYISGHIMALVEGDLHNARGFWNAPLVKAVRVDR